MTSTSSYADWIAVDWGTSRLRAWAMAGTSPRAEAQSNDGMGALARDEFESALLRLVEPWLGTDRTDVLACGMVGARQGWIETPYVGVPARPNSSPLADAPVHDRRLRVRIGPGLKQDDPPDVMRGEETQIAGWLARNPGWDGVLCLPGSHTKWAEVSAGEIVSFRTFMTGELFAALSNHTVLRHTIGEGWDHSAFAEAVSDSMARPEAMAARLFALRAGALLTGLSPGAAAARLSGLLIGAELAAARPYWLGQQIAVVGEARLAARYRAALTAQGLAPEVGTADEMTLAGLAAVRAMLETA